MKATITRYYTESVEGSDERPCFDFELEDEGELVWSDSVTSQAAHVLLLKFAQNEALAKLFVAITYCDPDNYTLLVGQCFEEKERVLRER